MSDRHRSALPLACLIASGALAQAPPPAPAGMTLPQYLSLARGRLLDRDADGDGRINAADFAAGMKARRGVRVKASALAAPPGEGAVPRMFARFDANRDGYLDKAEIDAMLTKKFERLDADHDGVITPTERQAVAGSMGARAGADR